MVKRDYALLLCLGDSPLRIVWRCGDQVPFRAAWPRQARVCVGFRKVLRFYSWFHTQKRGEKCDADCPDIAIQARLGNSCRLNKEARFLLIHPCTVSTYVGTCATQERVSGADLQKFQNSEAAFNTRECRVERKVEGKTMKNNVQTQHTLIKRGVGGVVAGRRNRDTTSVERQSPMRKTISS